MVTKKTITFGHSIACAALIGFGCYLIYSCYVGPQGAIQRIDSYTQAADAFACADSNTLILFDVDDTLIEPASILFRPKIIEHETNQSWLKELSQRIYEISNKPESYFGSIWRVKEVPLLIEPTIVPTIQALQDRGVKVMALTALNTGSDHTIPFLPEWRYSKLKELGIDFNKVGFPDIVFKELPEEDGHYPLLYHGILCTNSVSKGELVAAFLDHVHWKPSNVIFFDDSLKQVESVEQAMKACSIPFQGFHYLGAQHLPGELDKEQAEFQLKYLIEHEDWLSDEQARALMMH